MPNQCRAPRLSRLVRLIWVPFCLLFVVACHQDMYNQGRYEPLEPSQFFADNRSSRPLPAGSVQFGDTRTDTQFYTGRVGDEYVTTFPYPVDEAMIRRGQRQFNNFCVPCHGITGSGNGIVAQRGAFAVTSLHEQRLRDAQVGYIFDIISNGIGRMYSYGDRINEADRWAIIAYVRALQLSRNATPDDLPPEERARLGAGQ